MDFGVVGLDHHHHHHHGLGISSSSSSSSSSTSAGFGPNNVISSSSSSNPETKQRTLLYGSGLSCNDSNIVKQERSAGSALEEYWRSSKVAKTSSGCVDVDDDDFSSVCKGMMFQQRNNNNSTWLRSNSNNNNNNNSTSASTTTLSFLDNEHYNNQQQQQQQNHQMLSFSTASSTKSEAHNIGALPYFPNAYTGRNTVLNNTTANNNIGSMHGGVMMMRSGSGASFTAAQWMELEHQALIYKYITANVPIPSNLLLPIRKAFDSSFPSAALLRSNPLGMGGWGSFHLGFSNNADPEPGRCRRTDGKKWRCSRDAVADQKYCERHMNRGRHRSRKPVEGQAGANNNIAAAAAAASKPIALTGSAVASNANANALADNAQIQSFEINAASNRMFMNSKDNASTANGGLSLLSSRKPQQLPYDMSSAPRASDLGGLVSSDPQQSSLHHFIDDWPNKPRAGVSGASSWPDLGLQADRTQLSISIPTTTESNLSPLRLSREQSNANSREANWVPISWGTSMGGPLGEVLHQTNNNSNGMMSDHCKSSSSTPSSSVLNLMPEGWDSSPPMGSSPTGVLQKTAFGSLSNSSAGSSPRAHHPEGIDLLGGSLTHLSSSSSLPAL